MHEMLNPTMEVIKSSCAQDAVHKFARGNCASTMSCVKVTFLTLPDGSNQVSAGGCICPDSSRCQLYSSPCSSPTHLNQLGFAIKQDLPARNIISILFFEPMSTAPFAHEFIVTSVRLKIVALTTV
eukprot:1076495-Amphidinium_carterae.1